MSQAMAALFDSAAHEPIQQALVQASLFEETQRTMLAALDTLSKLAQNALPIAKAPSQQADQPAQAGGGAGEEATDSEMVMENDDNEEHTKAVEDVKIRVMAKRGDFNEFLKMRKRIKK